MENQAAEKVLERLKGVKPSGPNQWMACCPAHEDSTPSLSVSAADDGKVLLKCFAGCTAESIVQAIGFKLSDLFPPRARKVEGRSRGPVPPGRYICRIGKVKDGKGKDGSERWCVQWVVCAGPEKESLIFDWISATGPAASRLKAFGKAIGLDTTGTTNLTHDLVLGRTAMVEVVPGKSKEGEQQRTRVAYEGYGPPDQIAYDYKDEEGKLLFQAVRFRPKAFLQRKPNSKGGWIWTTKDVRRVIYRLPEILAAPREKIRWWCEGEKDCDRLWALGLVATTTSQGASSFGKTDDKALAALKGADVVVLPDNDKAGREYAGRVQLGLKSVARSVKALALPGLPDGGDVSDWLDRGGTREELERLASDSTLLETVAETAGRPSIDNYRSEDVQNSDGKVTTAYFRLPIDQIVASVHFATDGWPKRIGSDLFYDRDGCLALIDSTDSLLAYLHSVGDVRWRTGSDEQDLNYVTIGALMERLQSLAEVVHEVTDVTLEPPPKDRTVYVLKRRGENRSGACDGSFFRELLGWFNPASDEDAAILQAMALTPFWGGRPGRRPLFVVTGKEGIGLQSIGKSTVAEVIGDLVGGHIPIKLPKGDVADDIAKQLLSAVALSRRVVLLDNISGTLTSDELAQLITATSIIGRPAFGRQRERRNYLTWVATAVSPSLSEDLTKRSVVLELSEPSRKRLPTFREDLDEFIGLHLERLIREAGYILREARHPIISEHSRFPSWDREVLACHPAADLALARIHERQVAVDEREEEVSLFLDDLIGRVIQHSQTRVSPTLAMRAWNDANGTRYSARWVGRMLRQAGRKNQLPGWLGTPTRRGGYWLIDLEGARRQSQGGGSGPPDNQREDRADLF